MVLYLSNMSMISIPLNHNDCEGVVLVKGKEIVREPFFEEEPNLFVWREATDNRQMDR